MVTMRPAIKAALVTLILSAALGGCNGYNTPSSPPPSTWHPTYGASGYYDGSHYDGGVYSAGGFDRDVELPAR